MTAEPLLSVRELSAYATGTGAALLDGVTLTVPAGTVTAVVGPSGSGKTTLGLGALAASRSGVRLAGEVRLDGTELLALPEADRRVLRSGTVGHLPQHPESVLDPVRRTGGALRELAALQHPGRSSRATRAARNAAVRAALETAGLSQCEVWRRFPHQLSGGMQQRVALASTLVTGAQLLVLDEPTSGLDPVTARALTHSLRALTAGGTALLLLSHDLPLVRELAGSVTVLERGRAVETGPASQLLSGSSGSTHPLTRGLLAAERHTGAAPCGGTQHAAAAQDGAGSGVGLYGAGPYGPAGELSRSAGAWDAAGVVGGAYAQRPPAAPGADHDSAAEPAGDTHSGHTAAGVTVSGVAVRRRRGGSPLTGPVTLSFPPGSRTALIGPSGAGKTTFGRVLAGLTPATTGQLTVAGEPLPRRAERRTAVQRRAVQYVHQNSADSFEARRPLLGQLAAAGHLLRGLPRDAAQAEAHTLAEHLGLDGTLTGRTPEQLSGGQLQRCALVRALLARPALLVCDEATAALDTMTRQQVLDALPDLLAPAGTALLLISHDLAAVRETAHSVAVFADGQCVQQDSVPDLLAAPHPGTPAELLEAAAAQPSD